MGHGPVRGASGERGAVRSVRGDQVWKLGVRRLEADAGHGTRSKCKGHLGVLEVLGAPGVLEASWVLEVLCAAALGQKPRAAEIPAAVKQPSQGGIWICWFQLEVAW